MGLCRRFPAIVRELAVRNQHRPPFVIKDELEVQDRMRALLRGLFRRRPDGTSPTGYHLDRPRQGRSRRPAETRAGWDHRTQPP